VIILVLIPSLIFSTNRHWMTLARFEEKNKSYEELSLPITPDKRM
jgi:hypothetical protein